MFERTYKLPGGLGGVRVITLQTEDGNTITVLRNQLDDRETLEVMDRFAAHFLCDHDHPERCHA